MDTIEMNNLNRPEGDEGAEGGDDETKLTIHPLTKTTSKLE
jgi:hypothetical protein